MKEFYNDLYGKIIRRLKKKFGSAYFKSYSQRGEDVILSFLLNELKIKKRDITYLDLGANDPIIISNTFSFYKQGSKGILVEANPNLIKRLKRKRRRDVVVNKAISASKNSKSLDFFIFNAHTLSTTSEEEAVSMCNIDKSLQVIDKIKVESITVDEIIDNYLDGKSPTFISLDLEGLDFDILSSFNFKKYRPVAFIVEMVEYELNISAQDKNMQIVNLFRENNYYEYAFTGLNSIFVDAQKLK